MNLISLYEKLERLVGKLPESLQSPILREIRPLRTLFLHQRPPRILLLGDRAASRSAVVNALFSAEVAQPTEDHVQDGTWQLFSSERGRLCALDGRRPLSMTGLRRALGTDAPDVCLYLHQQPVKNEDAEADLEHASQLLEYLEQKHPGRKLPVIGIAAGRASETARRRLDGLLHQTKHPEVRERATGIFALQGGPAEVERLATAIVAELPEEAKLEMVRLANLRDAQRELAQGVVRSMSAICGAVGAQPIPLADFPILTGLQAGMVAGIMYISGRQMSVKLAGEWIGAVGANIGMALALREGARAVLKFIPIWGDLVSGGVAAAGTYAIGRAAIGYFIDGVTLERARTLFREKKKRAVKELAEKAE